ncbi:MAG: anhydro-N-acetylmuramic acid kinase [Bacteroidota bacterium]|nr:anhydro-N-acetylmuramic acid kinase [Bacteroidota bacterium]
MEIHRRWLSRPRVVVGAMSGTSCDGVDAAMVRLHHHRGRIKIELLSTANVEFSLPFRKALLNATEGHLTVEELAELGIVLMDYYRRAIAESIDYAGISPDAVGVHGQTLWHAPVGNVRWGIKCRTTFQLAVPAVLAAAFSVPVVSDVRTTDIILGGQGAPLVPILDWELLRNPTKYIIALNIGGIANITLLPPTASFENLIAFDTGPGNVWIDYAMQRYWGKRYDVGGTTAASGQIVPHLAAQLQKIDYVTVPPPKSTGRELFSQQMIEELIRPLDRTLIPAEDIITTLTWFTAWSIAENIRRYATDQATIVVSGGGAHNATLLAMLQQELPAAHIIRLTDYCSIPEQAKEAVLIAYIAYRTLGGLPSNIPSVTGASRPAILGSITPPP